MSEGGEQTGFDPVLLNLADADDYAVLVAAMYDYAGQLEHEANADEESARHFEHEPDEVNNAQLRASAARLQRMISDIERQLDANGVARREIEGGS